MVNIFHLSTTAHSQVLKLVINIILRKLKVLLTIIITHIVALKYCRCQKKNMNEVMTLAEDIHSNIWYQDTDSMHINYEEVEVLSKAFTEKYNKNLIGGDMGAFHIDFDLDDVCGEIYSIESYFLTTEVYIDILESVDKDGNTFQGNHVRIESVPTSRIQHTAKMPEQEPLDIYKHVYVKGNDQLFDLTENGGKCGF
jgi:hypothetical protein